MSWYFLLKIGDFYVTIMSHMPTDVLIWNALADSKRRQIVNLLEEKPRTTNELSKFFEVSRFAIMKHLKVLEQANLICVKREGRLRWNILNEDLVHFLRNKLTPNDGDAYQLVDILGLFPGRASATSPTNTPTTPVDIKQTLLLQATPSHIFEAFTTRINEWWDQRTSTDSCVHLEPFVNGRFYEALNPAGDGTLYATVTHIKQNQELRLQGTWELIEQITSLPIINLLETKNLLHITLQPQSNNTQLTLHHHISGGLKESIQQTCTQHWQRLLNQQFKPLVEQHTP